MVEQWDSLKRLFNDAYDRPRSEWPALVNRATADDPALGDRLAALLRAHEITDAFLESSPLAMLASVAWLDTPPPPHLNPGVQLGRYEIIAFIEAGGMGEVYRARDERLARDVAIKILPANVAGDTIRRRRMETEARAVGMLNHPNILTVYDLGDHGGSPFLVSELLEGETLRAALNRRNGRAGGWPADEAWRVVKDVAAGLAVAHARGIVHRDLKPENIFLTGDGRVKILDFGLATLSTPGTEGRDLFSRSDTLIGTVGYMAPEQLRGEPAGPPADVFAAGTILYELLGGRRPFDANTAAETAAAILDVDPVPLRSMCPTVPATLAGVVERCLAKSPSARYLCGAGLLASLGDAPPIAGGSRVHRTWRAGGRRRTALAAGVALLVSAGGWWMSGRHDPAPAPLPLRRVVAILPFKDVAADTTHDYFTAAVTEEIHDQLSKVSALRLLDRRATDRYAGADERRMAGELGAGSVLVGNVTFDHDRVRIAVRLTDTRTAQSIWSEQYDRTLRDVFALQGEVALQIAAALQAAVTPDERQRLRKRSTDNFAAYELYLKSQELAIHERAPNLQAIGLLRKALALDPTFAIAQARLAYRTLFLSTYDDAGNLNAALELARQAVALDGTLDEGHSALAAVYSARGEIANARVSFLRAMELNPNQFEAMTNLSSLDAELGRYDEALFWAVRAFQLVPNSPTPYYHVGLPLLNLGDDRASEQWLRLAEQRFPNSPRITILQAMLDYQEGKSQEALARVRHAVDQWPKDEELLTLLAELSYLTDAPDADLQAERSFRTSPDITANWWMLGESPRVRYALLLAKRGEVARATVLTEEAARLAANASAAGNQSPRVAMELAAIHAAWAEKDAAVTWLLRAYDAGWRGFQVLEHDPAFASLRTDPAFQAVVARLRTDSAAMARRVNVIEMLPTPPSIPASDAPPATGSAS